MQGSGLATPEQHVDAPRRLRGHYRCSRVADTGCGSDFIDAALNGVAAIPS